MSSQADGAIPASREASHPIDAVAAVAAISIGLGWFVLSTFVTEVGNLSLRFHFYDLWGVLHAPSRLITGLTDGDRLRGVLFGAVCLAVLVWAILPRERSSLQARLAALAPLVLMIVGGALLYREASTDFFADTSPPGSIGSHLTALANAVASRLSTTVSRHVTLGLGAYVSLVASVVLAARGLGAGQSRIARGGAGPAN